MCPVLRHLSLLVVCFIVINMRIKMTDLDVVVLLREALMTVLVVSAPILGAGMLVGLIIAVFQTTTSIQEQTLTFVPKMVAIFATIVLLASWMLRMLSNYTKNVFLMIEKIGLG